MAEQRKNKSEDEPNLYVEKAWSFGNDDETSSSVHHDCYDAKETLPEIEAKAEGRDIIIRVHCELQNGYLNKVVKEIEKLHLTVQNISSLPFGDYFLAITIIAQMGDEFCMTTEDFKRDLRQALLDLV